MKTLTKTQSLSRKPYDKPVWQKQPIFERFTLVCGGTGTAKTAIPCRSIGS